MAEGRSLALRTIKTVAAVGDRVRPPVSGVVVLIYHRVGAGSGTQVDLSPQAFDEQMAWLAGSGRVVSLDRALDLLAPSATEAGDGSGAVGAAGAVDDPRAAGDRPAAGDGGHAADDPVVVTFDDGTADLADVATPILERHGVPATVYLATRFVD